jgi:hypothetical protein
MIGKRLRLPFKRAVHRGGHIRRRNQPDMIRIATNRRTPGRKLVRGKGVAMIGVVGRYDPSFTGNCLCNTQSVYHLRQNQYKPSWAD